MTPKELEQLILLAGNASESEKQWKATNMLTQWVNISSDTIVPCLIELLKFSKEESATFFALTTLQRKDLYYEQRVELRKLLMSLKKRLSSHLEIKVGVLLANLIQKDFVLSWHSAFDELLHKTDPILCLRTLDILFEASYSGADISRREIKDALRGIPLRSDLVGVQIQAEQTISAQIIEWLLSLLQKNKSNNLHVLSLSVIKRMSSWIDLSLIINERVMALLFRSLQQGVDIAVPAMECLSELVGRGMDASKKVALFYETKILENIIAHVNLKILDASPVEVVIEVAKFVNVTGIELIPIWEDRQLAEALWCQLLDLFFLCFMYDDIDVSGAVIPLAYRMAVSMEKKDSLCRYLLPQFLVILFQQMKYPMNFQFDYDDDDEAEEEVYRTELRKLNQRLIRAGPETCLQFIGEALSNLPSPISTSKTRDVEAALRLVYHYCEGIRPSPGLKTVMKNETFCAILVALHRSDIALHDHREVLLLYYDIAVRYAAIFLKNRELLEKILVPLSSNRGLQHVHPRVRSRSCYLMLKLIKGLTKIMRQYVETVVTGIYNLIVNPKTYPLDSDDVLYLFEAIGILLGKTGLNEEEQKQSITKVMIPHVHKIEELLSTTDSNISTDLDEYGKMLSESVAAIAYLSKGFQSPPESVQIVLNETLKISLAVFQRLPSHDILRKNCVIVWQRMVLCLRAKVLQFTPEFLKLVIDNCTAEDIIDAAQMINQCCKKFKQNASPVLDAALLPFLQKCHSLIPTCSTGETPPQLKAEQLSLKKNIFSVLHQIVLNGVSDLLVSQKNFGNLKTILKIMGDGAISIEDPMSKKTCIQFFRLLLEQWSQRINDETQVERDFLLYLYRFLIPELLLTFLRPSFDGKDAMQDRVLQEFAELLLSTRNQRGIDEFNHTIVQTALRSCGCTQDILEAFLTAADIKQMQICLKETLKIHKNCQINAQYS